MADRIQTFTTRIFITGVTTTIRKSVQDYADMEEKNERLRTLEETYLADVVELYREGSLERMQAEWELQDVEQRNRLERERYYQQQLQQVREQYLGMSNTRQMEIAMQGLDELHRRGLLKEKEYQIARAAIQAQYAGYQTTTERCMKAS